MIAHSRAVDPHDAVLWSICTHLHKRRSLPAFWSSEKVVVMPAQIYALLLTLDVFQQLEWCVFVYLDNSRNIHEILLNISQPFWSSSIPLGTELHMYSCIGLNFQYEIPNKRKHRQVLCRLCVEDLVGDPQGPYSAGTQIFTYQRQKLPEKWPLKFLKIYIERTVNILMILWKQQAPNVQHIQSIWPIRLHLWINPWEDCKIVQLPKMHHGLAMIIHATSRMHRYHGLAKIISATSKMSTGGGLDFDILTLLWGMVDINLATKAATPSTISSSVITT